MVTTPDPDKSYPVLSALQLGWLVVESFGLLRRYARFGKPAVAERPSADKRLTFTEREPNLTERLEHSMQRLKLTAARLAPGLPPPVPDDLGPWLAQVREDRAALDQAWRDLDGWSCAVWQLLLVENPLAGRAFACGGDLADTYWHAQGSAGGSLPELLRSYRLDYLAERIGDLDAYLPPHAVPALRYSLKKWGMDEPPAFAEPVQKRLLTRLEAQVKVWHDLLFGLRQANSYLTAGDRRLIAWGGIAASIGLVILVGLVVWLAVLLLSSAGRGLASSAESQAQPGGALEYLASWENWSALLATASSVVAVLTGVVKGLSGWLWAFHQRVRQALAERQIRRRTYRSHR